MTSPILNIADVEMTDLAERARQRGTVMPEARFGGRIGSIGPLIGNLSGIVVFFFKAGMLVNVQMWVRWTLPRLRISSSIL